MSRNSLVCLIPHYNNPQGLLRSLASIDAAECCDVLVVDDGSVQAPVDEDAARRAFRAQGALHVLRLPRNQGIEHALNAGLAWIAERGYALVGRLDCGDENLPGRFARQQAYLQAHPEVVLLGGAASFVAQDGTESFVWRPPLTHPAILRALRHNSAFVHPTVVMRPEAVEAVGRYPLDVRAAEDYALFYALAQRFPVANLPDVLIRYELDPGGISLSRRRRQLLARLKVQGRHAGASPMAWLGMARTLTLLALPYGLVFSLKSRLRRGARAG